MNRPLFSDIHSGDVFNQWYWLKEEMVQICKDSGLPATGSKFELRDRIVYALDNNGSVLVTDKGKKASSNFNWAKEHLSLETIITDNVSFGPNFRNFMKAEIGQKFVCHSDFMSWVKEHPGKTLADAVIAWKTLEERKNDPSFQREIADHNMLAQYVRDFLEDNKGLSAKNALLYWKVKRRRPTEDGFIRYNRSDLELVS